MNIHPNFFSGLLCNFQILYKEFNTKFTLLTKKNQVRHNYQKKLFTLLALRQDKSNEKIYLERKRVERIILGFLFTKIM